MSKAREIVLRLVADGKISVEEAEELLDAIEDGAEEPFAGFLRDQGARRGRANSERGKAQQAQTKARQRAAEAREKAKAQPGRTGHSGYKRDFDFKFNFPWDQPDWQWPWEQEGWQWLWEQGSWQGERTQEHVSELEVPKAAQLKINVNGGDLTIQGNGQEASMRFVAPNAASQITTQDGVILVSSAGDDVVVEVPENVASIEIAQNGGDLVVGKLEAGVTAKVAGGDMVISEVTGEILASVEGGDARLTGIRSTAVEVQANGGDTHLSMPSPVNEGSVILSSSDDISLELPSDSQCEISAAAGGDIEHSLPADATEIIEERDNYLSAKVNGGGAEITLSANSGDIKIGI